LVAPSLISCLDDFQETLLKKFGDKSVDLREVVRDYLSVKRRDHPEAGCPTAALAGELARAPLGMRKSYAGHLTEFLDQLVSDGPLDRQDLLRRLRINDWNLQLARAVPDKTLSLQILQGGVEAAQTLIRGKASKQ
jgi:TetR/AcrR family transcriptional repressor of nem operon